jgi:UDP-N-acetylmuramate--alanine ligase
MDIVGVILSNYASNVIMGQGDILVAEADEYDRSFLQMFPALAVVTTIEADHLDCYADIDDIKQSFLAYMHLVPFYGAVIACVDDGNVREVIQKCKRPVIGYGLDTNADYNARNILNEQGITRFSLYKRDHYIAALTLPVPGLHNVRNACAACAVAFELGVTAETIAKGLASYTGVKRRFEIVGKKAGITLIDDYAHHPSEIQATLSAARTIGFSRIIAVFQPHLYTRTRDFMDTFAHSLCLADKVIVTGIYKAREEALPGVSAEEIVRKAREFGCADVSYIDDKNEIAGRLAPLLQKGDAIIAMGAGDIWQICSEILARIQDV